jgi:hypothetical protein
MQEIWMQHLDTASLWMRFKIALIGCHFGASSAWPLGTWPPDESIIGLMFEAGGCVYTTEGDETMGKERVRD